MTPAPAMSAPAAVATPLAQVNGVVLSDASEAPGADELRSRASLELLRQAAIGQGLLAADDTASRGVVSEAAAEAIEVLLDRELAVPHADESACRRYYAAHVARYTLGERVELRHVLFAVTPGVDFEALRKRAEACLLDLRARRRDEVPGATDRFSLAAAQWSNCPSGAEGGRLGWLQAEDCAPEFAREVFGHPEVGVLPRLVRTRFGLHVVEVLAREPGSVQPYEAVEEAVRQALHRQAYATALRQYLQRLAAAAHIVGVDIDAAASPLLQ